jgi:hypothetical protein
MFLLGLLTVFGAVGGMDNSDNNLLLQVVMAVIGLFFMYCGVKDIQEKNK